MIDWIIVSTGLDDFALLQAIAMSGICGFIVSQFMQGWMGPAFSYAGLFASALTSNLLCKKFGLAITLNKSLDGVLFSTIGIITATVCLVMGMLLFSIVNSRVGVSAQKLRAQADAEKLAAWRAAGSHLARQ